MQGPTLHVLDLNSMPVIKEGMLVTDEFCAQYRVLEREVEMLQEENMWGPRFTVRDSRYAYNS
jgi:hypothetical protein